MKSSAARSMPNDRRRVAPPPPPPPPQPQPVFFPSPMLPYNHPYAYTPPPVSWSFVRPQLPIPSWDNHTYVYTQTLPSLSSFVSPPPPPTPPSLPFWNNTRTLHPPSFPTPTPALAYNTPPLMHPPSFPTPTPPLPLHPPSNSFPPNKEEDLSHRILKQIEYYFCDNNLAKDLHLKDQMDIDNGWVSIEVIAGFNRIKEMTYDIKLILDSLKHSDTIEVEGDKLRRRTTWKKWIAYRKVAPYGIKVVRSNSHQLRNVKQRQRN